MKTKTQKIKLNGLSIRDLSYDGLYRWILGQLSDNSIGCVLTHHLDDQVDGNIELGSKYGSSQYNGLDIQIGNGYYTINKWNADKTIMFHTHGTGDLMADLKEALRYNGDE